MKRTIYDTAGKLVSVAEAIEMIIEETYPVDLSTEDKAEVLELIEKINYYAKTLKEALPAVTKNQ